MCVYKNMRSPERNPRTRSDGVAVIRSPSAPVGGVRTARAAELLVSVFLRFLHTSPTVSPTKPPCYAPPILEPTSLNGGAKLLRWDPRRQKKIDSTIGRRRETFGPWHGSCGNSKPESSSL